MVMKAKASYTVEAALIMPMVILIVALVINTGIAMHQETITTITECLAITPIDTVKRVRLLWLCEDVQEEIVWN